MLAPIEFLRHLPIRRFGWVYVGVLSALSGASAICICLDVEAAVTGRFFLAATVAALPIGIFAAIQHVIVNAIVFSVATGAQDTGSAVSAHSVIAEFLAWLGYTALVLFQAALVGSLLRSRRARA